LRRPNPRHGKRRGAEDFNEENDRAKNTTTDRSTTAIGKYGGKRKKLNEQQIANLLESACVSQAARHVIGGW